MKLVRLVLVSTLLAAASGCTTASEEKKLEEVTLAVPWMMQVLEQCETYKGLKGDAEKTDLAAEVARMLKDAKVTQARGRVDITQPSPSKPDEHVLQIEVAETAKFVSQSGRRAIKKGTPLYDRVVRLDRGQCVVFSAHDIEALATFEMGKVCSPHYYALFDSIEPCP